MGRLIDADKCKCGRIIEAILSEHNFPIIKEMNVSDIPTAYDPDKVVEQLEELRKECEDPLQDYDPNYFIDKAIEIVKGGGADG